MRSRVLTLALIVAAMAALLAPAAGTAAKKGKGKKDAKVTVMSRNLYLGADLTPAIDAADTCGAIDAGGQILNDVDASNFPARAKLLAKEIAKAKPDLLGLQEVALWRFQEDSDFTGTPATEVRYDFLKLLQKELKAKGAKYDVAVVQEQFDQELPADRDGSDATEEFICGADEDGRLTMRDAILVRKGGKVKASKPDSGQFENTYDVVLGGAVPISVDRGWTSVEAKVKGSKKTKSAKFRFVNTHLEAFGDPAIREAQARELFANGGPLQTKKQLVFLGDINSGGKKDKIGPPYTTPGDEGAYNALVKDFGLTNLGARQTCCYPDVFESVIGDYRFDHTVDHVMAKPKVKQLDAYVTGDDPSVTGPGGVVASDHGGVVSKLRLKR
jgi:hypothetical protein